MSQFEAMRMWKVVDIQHQKAFWNETSNIIRILHAWRATS